MENFYVLLKEIETLNYLKGFDARKKIYKDSEKKIEEIKNQISKKFTNTLFTEWKNLGLFDSIESKVNNKFILVKNNVEFYFSVYFPYTNTHAENYFMGIFSSSLGKYGSKEYEISVSVKNDSPDHLISYDSEKTLNEYVKERIDKITKSNTILQNRKQAVLDFLNEHGKDFSEGSLYLFKECDYTSINSSKSENDFNMNFEIRGEDVSLLSTSFSFRKNMSVEKAKNFWKEMKALIEKY